MIDDRVLFANDVCKLILSKNNYDVDRSLIDVKPMYEYFHEHVRNIYEAEEDIPLFNLYHYLKCDADNFDLTEEEYQNKIEKIKQQVKNLI